MALSNDYKACQVFDLDPRDLRRGPFIVVQTGVDAEDDTQTEKLFILRKDGVWVEYLTQAFNHPNERCDLCFETMAEVMRLLKDLPLEVTVERTVVPPARINEFNQQVNTAGGLLAFIQEEVERLQAAQHPGHKRG